MSGKVRTTWDVRHRYVLMILLTLSVVLVITAKPGTDAGRYFNWQNYFYAQDLSILSNYPKSLRGLPLSNWQYGSGLLAAIPNIVFGFSPPSIEITGAVLGIANLCLFAIVAYKYLKESSAFLLALTSLLLFTPAGFYLNAYSSESWTVFLTLCGIVFLDRNVGFLKWTNSSAFMLGAVCYFLILVKATNLIICGALVILYLLELYNSNELRPGPLKFGGHVLMLSVAPIIAVAFLCFYYYLINGSILASPYNFHDSGYRALSLGHFKFLEVLFASWHGLFFYHPLISVGLFWILRNRTSAMAAVILIAFVLQILIQGSWYAWWMGLGTFGARGFCGVSILLLYGIMRLCPGRLSEIADSQYKLAIVCAFGIFEAVLLQLGTTNYTSYDMFIREVGSLTSIFYAAKHYVLPGAAVLCAGWWLSVDVRKVWVAYILMLFPIAFIGVVFSALAIILSIILTLVFALGAGLSESVSHRLKDAARLVGNNFVPVSMFSTVCIFVLSVVIQARLLTDFASHRIAEFPGGRSFDCMEVGATYREYNMIGGYVRDKEALRAFLLRNGCAVSIR